ncbi:MAG: DUF333 domain-containing protein [Patescibacteria group bacterium]
MQKILISLVVFVFLAVGVYAAMNPIPAYCEHQGYIFEYSQDENNVYYSFCIFNENNKCDAREFYEGKCGAKHRGEFVCRKEGEIFFSQFEECCEGLESSQSNWWIKTIGQSSCIKKLNFFQRLWGWIF